MLPFQCTAPFSCVCSSTYSCVWALSFAPVHHRHLNKKKGFNGTSSDVFNVLEGMQLLYSILCIGALSPSLTVGFLGITSCTFPRKNGKYWT